MKERLLAWIGILFLTGMAVVFLLPDTRSWVVAALHSESSFSQAELERCLESLHDPDSGRRREAIERIGDMGPAAAEAIPALAEVARNDNISVRSWAISRGLARLGPSAVAALEELANDRGVRTVVIVALGDMGPQGVAAVPFLTEKVRDDSYWTRCMACVALAKLGKSAESALPALKKALRDDSRQVRIEAWLALKAVAPESIGSADAPPPPPPFRASHSAPLHATERDLEGEKAFRRLRVEFDGIEADRVPGFLYLPKEGLPKEGRPKHAAVLLQYGSGGRKDVDYIVALARQFVSHGFVVLTIDAPLRGERAPKGKSEVKLDGGKTLEVFRQYLGDYSRAIDFLQARPEVDRERLAYVGISWGAMTGVTFVAHDPRIKVIASIVGGGNIFARNKDAFPPQVVRQLKELDPAVNVGLIAPRPLLLLNATKDQLVPKQSAEALHAAAGKNSKVVWLDTDHFFKGADTAKVGDDVIRFVDENLKP